MLEILKPPAPVPTSNVRTMPMCTIVEPLPPSPYATHPRHDSRIQYLPRFSFHNPGYSSTAWNGPEDKHPNMDYKQKNASMKKELDAAIAAKDAEIAIIKNEFDAALAA